MNRPLYIVDDKARDFGMGVLVAIVADYFTHSMEWYQ